MNIYVGNLPYKMTDQELQSLFDEFGTVTSARVIMDRETGRSKGFGFVEMEDDAAAKAAIEANNEKEFMGRNLRVNESEPRPKREGGGGGGGRSRDRARY